ncbi:MAG: cytochrome c biogenesis heme-transporting ATPase CcmA [Burkholderiaceae bacterium]|jgi:heme exporter protein A|nr:cytochrome c biogenesis heme-transporting ATPase CcmA [Burkholderiaceae bacterium]
MSQLQAIAISCERGGRPLFAPQSFTLNPGQAMQIEGDNGSGKTSLLRMVCGLAPTASGEVRWGGQAISEVRHAFSRDLLYLGHSLGLKDELSAVENLRVASVMAGHPIGHEQAVQALQAQGLGSRSHLPLRVLSQGQKRRVALARLQLSKARLWVLDEPFVALDTLAVLALQQVLRQHLAQDGLLLFTSHQAVDLGGPVRPWRLGA